METKSMKNFDKYNFRVCVGIMALAIIMTIGILWILFFTFVNDSQAMTQEEALLQYKDAQIDCLQKKNQITYKIGSILLSEKLLIQQIVQEEGKPSAQVASHKLAQLDRVLNNLLQIRNTDQFDCNEDYDDKFLDQLIGKDNSLTEGGELTNE